VLLSRRTDALSPSGIRHVMALAAERERAGEDVIHMEVGQPHFNTPPHIVEAVTAALADGIPGYTPNLGIPSLREAVAERASLRMNAPISPSSVCITSGAVMALAVAIQATIDPGDEVLVPDPGWPNYRSAVAVAGGVVVPYRLSPTDGFTVDTAEIVSLLTDRTRMIIINSPANPTGVVIDEMTLRSLMDIASSQNVCLLSDEIYEDIVFRGSHHSVLTDGVHPNRIMVSGASKSYAMTGWRIGWLVGPESLVSAASKLIEPLTSCPASASQIAAEAALRGPQDFTSMMRARYREGLKIVDRILGTLGIMPAEPGGAFYLMVDVSATGMDSQQFVSGLLDQRLVAVAPGSTFGGNSEGYVRISTALAEDRLEEGCRRIRDYIKHR
jgi:aspartate/methionine/tyrosine aminotransferase